MQVSLELKFPLHPRWRDHLIPLYQQIRSAHLDLHTTVVVSDTLQAAAHRAAQSSVGITVPIMAVIRDVDAHVDTHGIWHINTSALNLLSDSDGWSVSWRILDAELLRASQAKPRRKPLAVWVCDQEAELRTVWDIGVDDVVTNRPLWARSMLESWAKEQATECSG